MSVNKKTHAETIADIVAEMRRGTKLPGYWRSCDVNEILQYHADRIDAAHKREASGNTAALREALKPVKRYLDGYTVNILELRRTVDAALTAPTRNCDRFASAEEAWDAYDAWVESYREKGETEPFNEFGWLFAPATEKEGGANG